MLDGDMVRMVTEDRNKEVRRKIPEDKRYIVYPETAHRQKDSDTDMRRKTRVGRRCQMALCFPA